MNLNLPKSFWKVLILSLVFTIILGQGYGQMTAHGRYEKELKSSDNGFTVVPLSEKGIALIHEQNKFKSGKKLWEVILLDSAFEETWQSEIEIKSSFNLIGYEFSRDKIYYLFRDGDREFYKFNLVQINLQDFSVQYFDINHEISFRITHFSVVGENAIFGGYVNREPTVVLFETISQKIKVIPGFFLKDTELLDIRVNHNQTFNALVIERNSLDKRHLVVKTFDETGALLLEDYIEIEKDKNLLTGISSGLKREELIVLGTYTEGANNAAIGYYSVLVDPFTEQPIRYIPFTELNYLLAYLPAKKASKIKARAKERIDMGRSPDYKTHILPIRIYESEEGFYFLSEMYDPATTNNRPYWNNNYNNPYYSTGYSSYSYNPLMNRYAPTPYSYNNSSQNGSAKMIESIITLFDDHGKLIWDNSLKFDNIKRYAPEQTSDFLVKNGLTVSAYKKEKEILMSTGTLGENPEPDTMRILLKNVTDIIRHESEEDSGVRFWNENILIVWGYQSLRDNSKPEGDQVRYVFYINKIEIN